MSSCIGKFDWRLWLSVLAFFISASTLYWYVYGGPRSEVLHQLAECMGEKDDYSQASYDRCVQSLRP